MRLLPTCREVSESFARGELEGGGALGRLRRNAHLMICAHCRKFARQLALIAAALRERVFAAPDEARVDALKRAVLARLRP